MYTITRPGDSWHQIAQRHYGLNFTHQHVQDLLCANDSSLFYWNRDYQLQNGYLHDIYCPLPEYRGIYLPYNGSVLTSHTESILRTLDSAPQVARENIAALQQLRVSPHYAAAAVDVTQAVKTQLGEKHGEAEEETLASEFTSEGALRELIGQSIEQPNESVQEAAHAIEDLSEKRFGSMIGSVSDEELAAAHSRANLAVNKAVFKTAMFRPAFNLERSIRSADLNFVFGESNTSGFFLTDEEDVQRITQRAMVLGRMGTGFKYADGLFRVGIVIKVAYDGGDWKREAGRQGADYAGGKAGGYAAKKIIEKTVESVSKFKFGGTALEGGEAAEGLATGAEVMEGVALVAEGAGAVALGTAVVATLGVVIVTTAAAIAVGYGFKEAFTYFYDK